MPVAGPGVAIGNPPCRFGNPPSPQAQDKGPKKGLRDAGFMKIHDPVDRTPDLLYFSSMARYHGSGPRPFFSLSGIGIQGVRSPRTN